MDLPQGTRRTHGRLTPRGPRSWSTPWRASASRPACRRRGRRLALTDRGLSLLARRDRTSVGVAKRRWSIALEDPEGPFEWRNVTGRRGRQLLRNIEHTARRATASWPRSARRPRLLGWEIVQIDPPRRASPPLQARRPHARRQPRRLRRPAKGRDPMGLPSWSGSAAPCGPPPCRTASLPICVTTHLTGPSTTTESGPPSWSSSDDEIAQTHFPARGAGGDAGGGGHRAPVGLPQGGHRRPGAAGTRLAHPRRVGVAPGPAAPVKRRMNNGSREPPGRSRLNLVQEIEKPCVRKTPTKRREARGAEDGPLSGSTRRPLWRRLNLLNRSQNWLAREIGDKPRIPLLAGQRGASALGTHPTSDAKGPRCGQLSGAFHTGGIAMTNKD